MLEGISGFYRVFRVFLAVSERFLLILKGFGQTYCVFGPIDPPDLEHWSDRTFIIRGSGSGHVAGSHTERSPGSSSATSST